MAESQDSFEQQVSSAGDKIVKSLNLGSTTGKPGFLELLIRGAFLDSNAYRTAADDEQGTPMAILALCLPAVAAALSSFLYPAGLVFAGFLGGVLIVSLVAGLISIFVAVAVMSALSKPILGTPVTFGRMLRGIAYAQSPGILAFVPLVGAIVNLWRLVTTWAAIKAVSGADGSKSAVLMVISALILIAISAVLSTVLLSSFLFGTGTIYP